METTIESRSYDAYPGVDFDHEQRMYDDTTTWLAETLDGSMRTSFEYRFDGQELYGEDGGALKPIFKDAINDAEQIAAQNPAMSFELRRRKIELEEYKDMVAMVKNEELPNTMVVVSDFPPELMDASEDVGGYNVTRKQTMLRVITRNDDGTIRMHSQSLDGSDRQALEAIYNDLGFKPEPGELLGQRMSLDLDSENQEFLADRLTGVYDRTLEAQDGQERYAGRTPADRTNTYNFVRQQPDLLEPFIQANDESLRYGLAAAMRARFEKRYSQPGTDNGQKDGATLLQADALLEMQYAGAAAGEAGIVFSGCGASLGSGTGQQLEALGYGNKYGSDQFGPLQFNCPKGHSNVRPHGKLIDCCKTCGTDVKC
jgi:hypothetical protein